MPSFTVPIKCHHCGQEIGKRPAKEATFPPSDPFPLPTRCPACNTKQRVPKARFVQRAILFSMVVVPAFLTALLAWLYMRSRN